MTNYFRIFVISLCFLIFLLFGLLWRKEHSIQPLNFPFEIKINEIPKGELGLEIHEIKVALSKKYYTEDNLKTLFKYFSNTYPDFSKTLRVEVFTDSSKLNQIIKLGRAYSCFSEDERKEITCNEAVYWRQGNSIASTTGSFEYFTFRPLIGSPIDKIVVLSGTLVFRKKKIIDEYQQSSNLMEIRVKAYELDGVVPKGIYYTFEGMKKGSREWEGFLTFRQDEYIPPSEARVHILNEKVSYVFMGWLLATTINGGESWSYWNAEYDLPNWKCCDTRLIQDVQINPDGSGVMRLVSSNETHSLFYTKDYGVHWELTQ